MWRISLSREHSREHHQEFPRRAEESCSENVATINPAFRRRISAGTSGCSLSRSITIVAEPHNLITAEVRRHPLSRSRLTSSARTGGMPVSKSHPGHTFVSFAGHSAHHGTYRGYETCRHVCALDPILSRENESEIEDLGCGNASYGSRDQLFRNVVSGARISLV